MGTVLKKNLLVGAGICCLIGILFASCNEEWKEEQYKKYISFVRSGYTETYLNTNTADGVVHYKIPIVVSGSTKNDRSITVEVTLDEDTLENFNYAQFDKTRKDLYFLLLDKKYYDFPNGMTVVIPAGKEVGCLDIDFKTGDLDLVEKYILPLKIASTSEYTISPKHHYTRTLMRIIPFNYFSGTYSAGAAIITANEEGEAVPTSVATREMRYVSDSTVFFYAGLCEEDDFERADYKIFARFNADNTMTFTANNDDIKLNVKKQEWKIKEEMDVLQPYLMIRTLTMDMEYSYCRLLNIAGTKIEVTYLVKGFYTLERRRNTQIPEEDQQEIFEW